MIWGQIGVLNDLYGENYMMKKILITVLVLLGLTFISSDVNASKSQASGVIPLEYLDCGVWAYQPHRAGSNVSASGEVSCATNHAVLHVVAGLRDNTYRYNGVEKYCYNTDYCSASVSLSYSSARQWQSDVSGYVGSWQAYYASGWYYIP